MFCSSSWPLLAPVTLFMTLFVTLLMTLTSLGPLDEGIDVCLHGDRVNPGRVPLEWLPIAVDQELLKVPGDVALFDW